ncbi:MAG: Flp family type IVb pilin [Alphaproteobacteria bacterium]|nr:Flp family type IVb pilin [Alphaproteobacteria bacterium]
MYLKALKWLKSLGVSDDGVTAIEYGLIAGLISVVIIVSMSLVGDEVQTTFDTWTNAVRNATQGANGS